MTISIIIAVKTWQKNLEECLNRCQELDYSDFEIIVLPDDPFDSVLDEHRKPNTKNRNRGTVPISVIPTGCVSPAKKRDIALNYASGKILAFIDDDVYPQRDWLKNAVKNFADESVAAVGGPAVTPSEDNLRQKASGFIYASPLVNAKFRYRYIPLKKRQVDDYPSCNFLVRKSIMQELGGFDTNFWPGEDTKLCLDITKKLRKKIIYDPAVLVYHHRRPIFLPHLKQIASYAIHRGYFVKRYPHTSLRLAYFLPSILVMGFLYGGITSLFWAPLRTAYFGCLFLYFFLVFIFSIYKELRLIPLVFSGIIVTHITYGIYFLKGLLSKKLLEET